MPKAIPSMPPKRCTIYVDGFNWYFGIFQHCPAWKWLNVQSFFEALRLDEEVIVVKFFTALVEPQKHVSPKRDRQKRFLKALGTLPKVKIILGKYQERTVTCAARDCPRRLKYQVPEEKKTDVNIAVNLLEDAICGLTDSMVIVSGDSDLEPAVEWGVPESSPNQNDGLHPSAGRGATATPQRQLSPHGRHLQTIAADRYSAPYFSSHGSRE